MVAGAPLSWFPRKYWTFLGAALAQGLPVTATKATPVDTRLAVRVVYAAPSRCPDSAEFEAELHKRAGKARPAADAEPAHVFRVEINGRATPKKYRQTRAWWSAGVGVHVSQQRLSARFGVELFAALLVPLRARTFVFANPSQEIARTPVASGELGFGAFAYLP
ncbi:MAG TPA: hypothetical protein VF294_07950 [Polyangiaceae bacterium]